MAAQLLENGTPSAIAEHADHMLGDKPTVATQSARVLDELCKLKPQSVAPLVERFVRGLLSDNKRVVQTCSEALPAVGKVAPARVAKHLDKLTANLSQTTDVGRDGLVRTFAALCAASVAYQKRLEPAITEALNAADGKTLARWTELVLPALKGEPHANARAVVEDRLYDIPRKDAQVIAEFLGVKLRMRPPPRY